VKRRASHPVFQPDFRYVAVVQGFDEADTVLLGRYFGCDFGHLGSPEEEVVIPTASSWIGLGGAGFRARLLGLRLDDFSRLGEPFLGAQSCS
jgi:hypothetical protein